MSAEQPNLGKVEKETPQLSIEEATKVFEKYATDEEVRKLLDENAEILSDILNEAKELKLDEKDLIHTLSEQRFAKIRRILFPILAVIPPLVTELGHMPFNVGEIAVPILGALATFRAHQTIQSAAGDIEQLRQIIRERVAALFGDPHAAA